MPFHSYPYTDYHELNLDYLLRLCRENVGLSLDVLGDNLRLVNANGEVISSVTVSYAEKALTDKNGKDISTYIFSAGTSGDTIVFTHGDNTVSTVTVPYAVKAEKDVQNKDILDYVYAVQVAGDKLRITKGDTTITEITVPYAVKASTDINGKSITTYGAALAAEGNKITLRDSTGTLINEITVPFATEANHASTATLADEATHAINADDADHADEADNADYATLAGHSTNSIETVAVSGDNIVFTTYGGTTFNITSPYSIKAQKDDLGNVIKTTYICNVTQNSSTGKLSFLDALGNSVVELTPIAGNAINDSYNNLIADYIKQIIVSQNSDYVTVTHGTGTVDTLTIHYSETAWKDTNGNVIKNTYVKDMECIEDVDDGHYKLVAYNGDTPQAELFRFEVYAYAAQCDVNGKELTTYVADLDLSGKDLIVKDGESNVLETLALPIPPVYVIKCSDSVSETSWTDWQAGGRTLATPSLFKDGEPASWSELTPDSNVSFELTSDGGTNFHTFKLSEVTSNPDYGSSSYQFEYIGSESGSLPNSFAYIVRIGFFNGNMNTKKGYRIPLAAQGGGGGGSASVLDLTDGSGNSIPLTDAQQVGTVQLRLSGTPKTFTQVNTLLQSGSVVIKDSDGSLATIESTSAQNSSLVVPYFNGNSRNVIKLVHQWNGNYGVSSVN